MNDGNPLNRGRFRVPVDQRAVAEAWAKEGFSCQLWVDPPGREWSDFVHPTRELVTVLEGRLLFEMQGQSWELLPGDELLIPSDTVHTVRNVNSGESRWLFGYDK